jgi:phage tail sheath gpL-like
MSVSFVSIPVTLRTPGQYSEVSSTRAVDKTPVVPHVALCIGLRLAAGTVAQNVLTYVPSADAADGYFGEGSQLANMVRAFKDINPDTELWAIGVNEAAGTAATWTITTTGPATADGKAAVYVEGRRTEATISSGDTADAVALAIQTQLALETDLSITFAVPGAAIITGTAVHKGTSGNDINIQHSYLQGESLPAGVTIAVAAGVAGATDPSIASAIAAMADIQFDTIACGFADDTNLDLLEAELEDRWGPLVQKPGIAFVGFVGTQGDATTYGNARNSKHTVAMAAGVSPAPDWLWAAVTAAVDAKETDPARPRQTLALTPAATRYFAPKPADRFTQAERNTLLYDGMSTHRVDNSGIVRVERMITTYQTNASGVADTSYLDITTPRTLNRLRYSINTRISLKFPRHKLANDGTRFSPGQAVVTPSLIKSELLALFLDEWEIDGLVEGAEQFKEDLLVERNAANDNRVDIRMSPDLINQFMVFANQIQFLL